jgi:hypothetical protein
MAATNRIRPIPDDQWRCLTGESTIVNESQSDIDECARHAGSSGHPIYPYDSSRNGHSYNYGSPNSQYSHHTNGTSPSMTHNGAHHHNNSHHILLFDPDHPQRPHPTLMPHFIQLFFEQLGAEFPFISYEEILGQFCEQSLAPLLSNCIASLAVRYVGQLSYILDTVANRKTIGSLVSRSLLFVAFIPYRIHTETTRK